MAIIYKTTNLITNKIYIGKSKFDYDPNYLGSGTIITQAIRKYGRKSFEKTILEFCSLSKVDEREKFWIKEFDSTNRIIGYNIAKGGTGGDTISHHPRKREIADRHSKFLKSYWKTANTHPWKKKRPPLSEEQKAYMSASRQSFKKKYGIKEPAKGWTELRRLKFSLQRRGENNYFWGKKHTDEAKAKISATHKGKPKTSEQKEKISQTLAKHFESGAVPGNSRKVIIDGISFNSMQEASQSTGINYSTLRNRLKNPRFPNTYFVD